MPPGRARRGVLEATRPRRGPWRAGSRRGRRTSGLWVGGFVAYEAAPGLDPRCRSPPLGIGPIRATPPRLVRDVRAAGGNRVARATIRMPRSAIQLPGDPRPIVAGTRGDPRSASGSRPATPTRSNHSWVRSSVQGESGVVPRPVFRAARRLRLLRTSGGTGCCRRRLSCSSSGSTTPSRHDP